MAQNGSSGFSFSELILVAEPLIRVFLQNSGDSAGGQNLGHPGFGIWDYHATTSLFTRIFGLFTGVTGQKPIPRVFWGPTRRPHGFLDLKIFIIDQHS